MWRSGETRQRRQAAVARMVTAAADAAHYTAPWRRAPHVWEHFNDEGELLRELHREWRTALAGAVYCAIEAGEGNLHDDVVSAWTTVSRRHRHVRSILEAHRDHPAIAAPMAKERALLATFLAAEAGHTDTTLREAEHAKGGGTHWAA